MTDLKNIIEISFPDGISVVCVTVHAILFFPFFIFIFIFSGCGSPRQAVTRVNVTHMLSLFRRKKVRRIFI